ncbi:MAG: zeta toxin family protein [Lachnospiraceae bacterium]|nr:zeta toxin family protein [Lachnospiraceae bacterium]
MKRRPGILSIILAAVILLYGCGSASGGSTASASTNASTAAGTTAESSSANPTLPEGVTPVTWEVSAEHPMIDTDEARVLYNRIHGGDYPTLQELENNPIVKQLDALSDYYNEIYGDTSKINTPEREKLRSEILEKFLSNGSARLDHKTADGYLEYKYDGPLKYEYKAEIVMGLPASGKSSMVADPDSEKYSAFNLDSDIIKEMLPEYKESRGAATGSIHQEGREMLNMAVKEFTEGKMKGCNVIIQTIGHNLDELQARYIKPFEDAGYNVKIIFAEAKLNESLARAVMRGLRTGRIIKSSAIIGYGYNPEKVYNTLAPMKNAKGETYGYDTTPIPSKSE